jgi:hypothetical protein
MYVRSNCWQISGGAVGRFAVLKLNSGFGLTQKAPDIAPEVGVLFRF